MARASQHTLSYCALCECDMVICATCGNNCCNAGYGTVDGETCPDCPEAYEDQTAYNEDPNCVRFANDTRESVPRTIEGLRRIGLKEMQELGFLKPPS